MPRFTGMPREASGRWTPHLLGSIGDGWEWDRLSARWLCQKCGKERARFSRLANHLVGLPKRAPWRQKRWLGSSERRIPGRVRGRETKTYSDDKRAKEAARVDTGRVIYIA